VEQAGLRVNIQPETFTIPELVESIRGYLKADQKRFES
jgi:hypothetical protein